MSRSDENHLRWLCRRGMLELDAWLTEFLDRDYPRLPEAEQSRFAELLKLDDFTLFDWLTGRAPPPEAFARLVARMRIDGRADGGGRSSTPNP